MTQYILLFIFMFHESIKKKNNTQKSLLDIIQHFKKKDWIVKQCSHSSFLKSVAALLTTIIEDVTKNEIVNDWFISVNKQMIEINDDVIEKIQNSSMTAQNMWEDTLTVAVQKSWMSTKNTWDSAEWINSETHDVNDDEIDDDQKHKNTQKWWTWKTCWVNTSVKKKLW